MDNVKGFVIKAAHTKSKNGDYHVSNFYIDSDVCKTPFQALEKLVEWMNSEFGENFQIKDLSDIEIYKNGTSWK